MVACDGRHSATGSAPLTPCVPARQVGIGWWLFIDGMVTGQKLNGQTTKDVAGYAWLPGVGVTLAFVMINGFDWDYMRSDANEMFSGSNVGFKARCFLFVAILMGLGSLCGAMFIMMGKYRACAPDLAPCARIPGRQQRLAPAVNATPTPAEGVWPGVSIFAQSCLVFFACVAPPSAPLPTPVTAR